MIRRRWRDIRADEEIRGRGDREMQNDLRSAE